MTGGGDSWEGKTRSSLVDISSLRFGQNASKGGSRALKCNTEAGRGFDVVTGPDGASRRVMADGVRVAQTPRQDYRVGRAEHRSDSAGGSKTTFPPAPPLRLRKQFQMVSTTAVSPRPSLGCPTLPSKPRYVFSLQFIAISILPVIVFLLFSSITSYIFLQ